MGRWILNNFALKIGSVAIAVLLWAHVVTERWVVETVSAPIKFLNLPDDLVVTNDIETESQFQVRTKVKQSILLAYFGHPFMRVDLSDVTQGSTTLELKEDLIVLPSWRPLEIVGIIGSRKITIETDTKEERSVPVKPIFSGSPLEGNAVGGFSISPDTVPLIGGKTQLRGVKEIYTDTIDISGRHQDYRTEVELIMPGAGFSSPIEKVAVQVTFERHVSFKGIRIMLKGEEHLRISPETLEVTVSGPQALLDEIESDDIKAFVDARESGTNVTPFFNLPKGIVFKACDPPYVKVIEGRESKE
jgi:hypothetical protein